VRLTHVSFFCRVTLASLPLTTNDVLLRAITKLEITIREYHKGIQAAMTSLTEMQKELRAFVTELMISMKEIQADVTIVKNQMALMAFKPNTVLSISQVGQEAINDLAVPNEVFPPVDGAPSVLNQGQREILDTFKLEKYVVEYLTPHFERIFAVANANLVVVNSENYKWIDTDRDQENFQNPDLLICRKALYTASPTTVDGTHRFGGLSNWILRDCIGAIMEAKLSFAGNLTSAVGQIVNYGALLVHNCNKRKVVKGVLFDKNKFYCAYMNYGKLSRLVECKWTDAGSETFLRESLYRRSSWMKLLDAA
jgi:hypothetical protein